MARLVPLGARILVRDIIPKDDISARMQELGLHSVTFEHNLPRPTTGLVVAVGSDPEVQELIKVGDTVYFGKNSGVHTTVEGEQFRSLEFHEITSVLKPE